MSVTVGGTTGCDLDLILQALSLHESALLLAAEYVSLIAMESVTNSYRYRYMAKLSPILDITRKTEQLLSDLD